MKTILIRFVGFLFLAALLQTASYYFLAISIGETFLIASYIFQAVLGVLSVLAIQHTAQRYPNSVAFAFLGASLMKFVFYFLIFHPFLTADGDLSLVEKCDVIVPYLTTLFLETYFGIYRLNKL